MSEAQREIVAVMFTDVSGYSTLAQRDEALALELLELKRGLADPVIAAHGGRLVKTIGDALMVEFKSALEAVRCATDLQIKLHEHNAGVPEAEHIRVRIGVHLGDVVRKGEDIFGDTVNIAARVEPQAPAGGVAMTFAVYEQIRGKFDRPVAELGQFHLKGIQGSTPLYAVLMPWDKHAPRRVSRHRHHYLMASAVFVIASLAVTGWRFWPRHAPSSSTGPSVAVLPFDNLSGDPNNAYFSSGTQDEILTRLAQIGGLTVISRTSTLKYASHPENLKQVGQELGVSAVLEGSVQRAGDTVRVNVQLIDAATDSHLWAETYDRSMQDIFAAESDIAQKIAESLQVKLEPGVSVNLARAPTHDSAAYDLFLRARYFSDQVYGFDPALTREQALKSIDLYSQAIAKDPGFGLAYAERSRAESNSYWSAVRRDDRQMAQARSDAAQAQKLAPDLAETHLAQGFVYYYGDIDFPKAKAEFERARDISPNDIGTVLALSWISRRTGDFAGSNAYLQRAVSLDPAHKATYLGTLEANYEILGQLDKAQQTVDEMRTLMGDTPHVVGARVSILTSQGRVSEARALWTKATQGLTDPDGDFAIIDFELARLNRDPAGMLKATEGREFIAGGMPAEAARAHAYADMHDVADATAQQAIARRRLMAMLAKSPDSTDLIQEIAYTDTLPGGDPATALKEAQRAVDLDPLAKDPLDAPSALYNLAVVRVRLGLKGPALDALEQVLAVPTHGNITSVPLLRLDPDWDSVRGDPRFEALLARYDTPLP